jgi:hypothetical protein
MADEETPVPEGAAVFPEIPAELGVNPLLLAVLHSMIFLAGSDDEIVNPAAADEAVSRLANYMARLDGEALDHIREDMECLVQFAKGEKWPKQVVQALRHFLKDCGIDGEEEA